jgi:ATP-dependent Clp protease ATP-binding subunit ClpA
MTAEISGHDAGRGDDLMAKFSRNLEQSLHRALALANERHHEYATLEHLLLALVDDGDAAPVMRACNVDIEKLRRGLETYVQSELGELVTDGSEDSKPTAGFQRTIQRAVIHVQASGREEVTGANVLVAIFAERESHAAYFLQEQEMTRYDAVNYIVHGIAKRPGLTERPTPVEEQTGERSGVVRSALNPWGSKPPGVVLRKLTEEERTSRAHANEAEERRLAEEAGRPEVVDAEALLQFFADEHLPEHLREHSKPFGDLARRLVETLPSNPERTMALRKLLEAKDCAVRAKLFK